MRFYEFEAKKLLAKQGVRLPEGGTAATPAEARHLAAEISGPLWQADRSGPRRYNLTAVATVPGSADAKRAAAGARKDANGRADRSA
jgi:succinyl-CoA synthetase beta subunit